MLDSSEVHLGEVTVEDIIRVTSELDTEKEVPSKEKQETVDYVVSD